MFRLFVSTLVVGALAGAATAQVAVPYFNVDIGVNVNYPAPTSAFSGATAQAGF